MYVALKKEIQVLPSSLRVARMVQVISKHSIKVQVLIIANITKSSLATPNDNIALDKMLALPLSLSC